MSIRLGIGIVTCNRKDVLAQTLARVQAHTTTPFTLVVADDGSQDGTHELLRSHSVIVVTGINMGIAWNKNRALFLLNEMLLCDVVILLEDDSFPIRDGWERDWLDATQRWGHANLAGDWFSGSFLKGTGTPDDPILSKDVTAQCSGFTRQALLFGGYFDSRFRGFGQEHVELSRRLIRTGYGGIFEAIDGEVRPIYKLLRGGIEVSHPQTFFDQGNNDRNFALCHELLFDEGYRAPWRDDSELAQFRQEIQAALGSPVS